MSLSNTLLSPIYFNSIKVRLEQIDSHEALAHPRIFQFHKGTIRTKAEVYAHQRKKEFQFHKGTIRTGSDLSERGIQ